MVAMGREKQDPLSAIRLEGVYQLLSVLRQRYDSSVFVFVSFYRVIPNDVGVLSAESGVSKLASMFCWVKTKVAGFWY
jgi:hypothetical protein